METETIVYIYIYMSTVWAVVHAEKVSVGDIVASVICGLLWPILLPADLLKKLFN